MRALLLLCLALFASPATAVPAAIAQNPAQVARASPAPLDELDVTVLEQAMQRTRDDPALEADERQRILDLYDQALGQLSLTAEWEQQLAAGTAIATAAPTQLAAIQAELATEPAALELDIPNDTTAAQVELLLAQAESDFSAAQALSTELQVEQGLQTTRRSILPSLSTEARTREEAVDGELESLENPPVSVVDRVLRIAVQARARATRAEVRALEQELTTYEARDELLGARRTLAVRRATQLERVVKAWRVRANDQRRLDAELDEQAAERTAAAGLEVVRVLAEENRVLAAQRNGPDGLLNRIERVTEQADAVTDELQLLLDQRDSVKAKVLAAGSTPTIGLLLKDHSEGLLDIRTHRAALKDRQHQMGEFRLQMIDIDERYRRTADVDRRAAEFIAQLTRVPSAEELPQIESSVRELFLARLGLLEALKGDYRDYITRLTDLEITQTQLIEETVSFAAFIDERVLWVRVAPAIHSTPLETWRKTGEASLWLLNGPLWGSLLTSTLEVFRENPVITCMQALLLGLLLIFRPAMRRRIADDAYLLGRIRTDRFTHTVRTTVITLLLAAGPPLLLWILADVAQEASGSLLLHGRAVSQGLRLAASGYFVAELVWNVCRRKGLAEAHFRWPVLSLKLLRRHMRWLMVLGIPVLFVEGMLQWHGDSAFTESLGRLVFMAGQLMLVVFAYRVLRPSTGVVRFALERQPTGWLSRLRWIWFPLALGMPLALFGMSELGYLYTAHQLWSSVQETVLVVLGLIFLHAMLTRWLFVARRQLGLRQHRMRRAAAQVEAGGAASSLADEYVEEEAVDIPSVSAQSQRLVQVVVGFSLVVGLLLVWADVLPALNGAAETKLWTRTTEVLVKGVPESRVDPITVGDLLIAFATLLFTIVGARNLPGLLEISILQRLPLQRAGRYAITTVSRYLISVIGIVFMFGSMGIGWDTVQWLAAAVSVGLGFGLQEIFANFVSGLILLFERPIRVGDTVTVDSITGTVTRIHMRATTIVTWDRTELIVPNRKFITSELVNWTLSDSVLRVIIKVGIAYGSDTRKAEELLYKIAAKHPDVLDDPKSRVIFTSFGDSSLDFELRVFVTDPELFRTISHPINNAIDVEFRAAGIEIAFPQRDLHIKSMEGALGGIPHVAMATPRPSSSPA